ncbi:MAG: class I SAM-dependent methyltransferase [Thermoanaerobaculia bacterium]
MRTGEPSRTALAAASHWAAHQIFEGGRLFADPLAVRILGEDGEEMARRSAERPHARRMRIFIAVRSRFAETALASAVESGVRQLVVLGAGLDTFAYRSPLAPRLRIFEVDHPVTQAWKKARLEAAGISAPESLVYAPVDFSRQSLAGGLGAAGFDSSARTFLTWLGVVPYLEKPAIESTLRFVGGLAGGAQIVFDYGDPPETLPAEIREVYRERAARVAELGEPWLTFFEPEELQRVLLAAGFSRVEDLGPREIAERYFPGRAAEAPSRGGHVVLASTI